MNEGEPQPRRLFGPHRRSAQLGFALGALPALVVGVVLASKLQEADDELAQRFRPLRVAVAARALAAGERLGEADLDLRSIPAQQMTGSLVLWDWRVMALGPPLVAAVAEGELLRWSDFDPGSDAPSTLLRPGMVGVNVDTSQLGELKPGERLRLRRRGRYTGLESDLVADARVVAFDGTIGPEPGPDEKADAVLVALLEVPEALAGRVVAADVHGELVLERIAATGSAP
ncbi:MAG: SAF domain-containing protein [Myxococcales bacterium]